MSTTGRVINCVFNTIAELGDPSIGSPFADIVDTVAENILHENIIPRPRNIEKHTLRAIEYGLNAGILVEPQKDCFKVIEALRDPQPTKPTHDDDYASSVDDNAGSDDDDVENYADDQYAENFDDDSDNDENDKKLGSHRFYDDDEDNKNNEDNFFSDSDECCSDCQSHRVSKTNDQPAKKEEHKFDNNVNKNEDKDVNKEEDNDAAEYYTHADANADDNGIADEDIADEDIVDEDIADEDIADEDIADDNMDYEEKEENCEGCCYCQRNQCDNRSSKVSKDDKIDDKDDECCENTMNCEPAQPCPPRPPNDPCGPRSPKPPCGPKQPCGPWSPYGPKNPKGPKEPECPKEPQPPTRCVCRVRNRCKSPCREPEHFNSPKDEHFDENDSCDFDNSVKSCEVDDFKGDFKENNQNQSELEQVEGPTCGQLCGGTCSDAINGKKRSQSETSENDGTSTKRLRNSVPTDKFHQASISITHDPIEDLNLAPPSTKNTNGEVDFPIKITDLDVNSDLNNVPMDFCSQGMELIVLQCSNA